MVVALFRRALFACAVPDSSRFRICIRRFNFGLPNSLAGHCDDRSQSSALQRIECAGRPGLPSIAEGISMVVTAIGLYLLVPRYGFIGAAIISSIAYTTSFLLMLVLAHNQLGLSLRTLLVGGELTPEPFAKLHSNNYIGRSVVPTK